MAEEIDSKTRLAQQGFFEFKNKWMRTSPVLVEATDVSNARIYFWEGKGFFNFDYDWILEITSKSGTRTKIPLYTNVRYGRIEGVINQFHSQLTDTLVIHRTWMRDNNMVKVQGGEQGAARGAQQELAPA